MSDFMKSTNKINQVVMDASTWKPGSEVSYEGLREALKNQLARDGVIARDAESLGYGARLLPGQHTEPAASLPATPAPAATCFRVLYLHGNSRHEIYGVSDLDLDRQENALRQMYAGRA